MTPCATSRTRGGSPATSKVPATSSCRESITFPGQTATTCSRRSRSSSPASVSRSTERARELGDRRWHDLIEQHHTLIRRELERFRGREVDTAGDGFLATFDG